MGPFASSIGQILLERKYHYNEQREQPLQSR